MLVFAATIFTGAFLLFQVQPLIAKFILPWFGGSPAVWTSAMLFFQLLLLAGYAYAHFSIQRFRPSTQASIHLVLLLAALVLLPIVPAARWKPNMGDVPAIHIILLLTATIGLPYFLLASTSPLLQAWISRLRPNRSPYRLFALSNAGSLLALVSYPFVFEPAFGRTAQAHIWSWSFAGFAAFSGACLLQVWRSPGATQPVAQEHPLPAGDDIRRLSRFAPLLWVGLPAAASALLLATTNQISQDVAVIPLLWVLPLSLYLLTFIIAFDHERWYRRWFAGALLPVMALVLWIMHEGNDLSILIQIGGYCLALVVCCMACHGELARLKPHPRHLTEYYLMIAGGGALGGILVALIAPVVFTGFLELHLGLLAACGFVLVALMVDGTSPLYGARPRWGWAAITVAYAGLAAGLGHQVLSAEPAVRRVRNFYGVLGVVEKDRYSPLARRTLRNGVIDHGLQFLAPDKRRRPTTYFTERSGIGLALRSLPEDASRYVGVVGLGIGTLATYGRPEDRFRFYEINPDVWRLARTHFTYLADSDAHVEVVLGDARLSLEREAPQSFDILVLDAFSSDAIPVHLLTAEAFELYTRHLAPNGILAVHITNRYLDLRQAVQQLAAHVEMETALVVTDQGKTWEAYWMLLARSPAPLRTDEIVRATRPVPSRSSKDGLWTDDYANLLTALDF